ncbi:FKBP-type peptidyl-prolyl cis-trans isomerase [Novosphingobium sp.]|uniref:FKBP-type peptidyl-prolyl cis-trans isomerase n=1 Tax=Novosphingobium sp. TaxID=1874826 RepID=UPI003BA95756
MSTTHYGLRRIALTLSLAACAALSASAHAQAAKPAAAPAPAPSSEILPVPLNPVVPAAQRVCSAKTASGLGTRMLRDAAGAKPGASDYVLVNYIGYLAADGTVFDQNVSQAFPAGGVIKGFSEGLQLMNKGSVWRFCIPAALGYGEKAAGPIPANADLVFQVELVDFKTEAEIAAMRAEAQKQAAQPSQGADAAAPAPAPAPAPAKPKK